MNIGYPDTKNKKGSGGPLLKRLTQREKDEAGKKMGSEPPRMNYNLDLRPKPTIRQT
tara:strand:+ start:1028 stop:1198 length:171 start_codon:yes stop_codon:yes gene_type:complete